MSADIEDGVRNVSYRGVCKSCGLKFTLTQQHDMGA